MAIASGFSQHEFHQKVKELENEKAACETHLSELFVPEKIPIVTEETLQRLLSLFKQFVMERT